MPDFHNSFVQFIASNIVALFIGVAAVLVSVLIYRKQKSKKEITYTLVSSAPIVSIKPSVADRIKILLDGNEIRAAQLVVLAIKNTGTVAVKREDYDEPITIDFPSRKILSGDVLSTKPDNLFKPDDLKTFLAWNDSSMTLAKQLLNPKEEILLSFLLKGSEVEPRVRGRIVDGVLLPVQRNNKATQSDIETALLWRFVIFVVSICAITIVSSQLFAAPNMRTTSSLPTFLGAVLVFLVALGVGILIFIALIKRGERRTQNEYKAPDRT